MIQSKVPLFIGLGGLTAGLVTTGYILEREKRDAMQPRSQLDQVLAQGNVVMFGTTQCSFCRIAQSLLEREHVPSIYINLDKPQQHPKVHMPDLVTQLMQSTKCQTVPQIFINGKFIGGSVELQTMSDNGELEKLRKT